MSNVGMSRATPGTLITARTVPNMNPRHRNRSRDRAYPARLSKKTRAAVTTRVMTTELVSHRMIGTEVSPPIPKMRFHAVASKGFGTRLMGLSVDAASVLNDVEIWMRNG